MSGNELVLVTVASLTIAIVAMLKYVTKKHRDRAHQLQLVESALDAHYAAAEQIFENPAVPTQVRRAVAFLTEAISDRDLARQALDEFLSDKEVLPPEGFQRELKEAFASSPTIADNLTRALHSGMVVLLFRWPENAERMENWAKATILQRRQEERFLRSMARAAITSRLALSGNAQPVAC